MSDDDDNYKDDHIHYEPGSTIPILGPSPKNKDAEDAARHKAQRAYEGRQTSLQIRILWTQIGLVIFGLIGAGVSVWQAKTAQDSADISDKSILLAQKGERDAMISGERQLRQSVKSSTDALNQSRDQFVKDERPYVWISGEAVPGIDIGRLSVKRGGQHDEKLIYYFAFKNYGKSPAIRVSQESYISFNVADPENDLHWKADDPSKGAVMPPSGSFWGNAASAEIADQEAIAMLASNVNVPPNKIVVHILFRYSDQIGNRYSSEVCLRHLGGGGTFDNCVKHSKIR